MSELENFYSAADICKIIKECHKSGVSSILLPEIDIYFGEQPKADLQVPIIHPSVEDQPLGVQSEDLKTEISRIVEDQESETMHLVDPQEWEKSELMEMDKDEARR
jgi:hypothetical protein